MPDKLILCKNDWGFIAIGDTIEEARDNHFFEYGEQDTPLTFYECTEIKEK